jgi:hypothetical protein
MSSPRYASPRCWRVDAQPGRNRRGTRPVCQVAWEGAAPRGVRWIERETIAQQSSFLASADAYMVNAAIYDIIAGNSANRMGKSGAVGLPQHRRVLMNFFIEYFKLIDLLALAALAALACAALVRDRSVWLFVAGILVAIWGTMRVMGWP